jgi:hypothetical protein
MTSRLFTTRNCLHSLLAGQGAVTLSSFEERLDS